MLEFALTIFTSAFLLFQIQPLITKFILPWFGGGTAVWAVSMLFFQSCLVAGYGYAHLSVRYLGLRRQTQLHIVFLLLAMIQIPISPSGLYEFDAAQNPTLQILSILIRTIGAPFLVLSATAPLIQAWASEIKATNNPYRLYALSNVAALAALLSYPFIIEPIFNRQLQAQAWSMTFLVFTALCVYCAFATASRSKTHTSAPSTRDDNRPRVPIVSWLLWLMLPATAVTLLLSVTNQLTRDLVSIPFLWVMPLSVYLLTFIIAFDNERWYRRRLFLPLFAFSLAWILYLLLGEPLNVTWTIIVFMFTLFVLCMVCHGELYLLRPEANQLTGYYLVTAIGGALGSAFVSMFMPIFSDRYIELQIGVSMTIVLVAFILIRDKNIDLPTSVAAPVKAALIVSCLAIILLFAQSAQEDELNIVYQTRNFYGVLTVERQNAGTSEEFLLLRNGNSYHGAQPTTALNRASPITYYSPGSGIDMAMNFSTDLPQKNIGMIGLGIGTAISYAGAQDTVKVYEINSAVVDIANRYFTYLSDAKAEVDIVLGDARKSLEKEPPQAFDILILDAFSSDAIPVHLLTQEAFELYLKHLKPNGIMAVLISSWHFDFQPLLSEIAISMGFESVVVKNHAQSTQQWASRWMILTKNRQYMSQKFIQLEKQKMLMNTGDVRLWTDDFSSPFQLLKK
jgi:spermidine synthase